jgi:hypothetical protein
MTHKENLGAVKCGGKFCNTSIEIPDLWYHYTSMYKIKARASLCLNKYHTTKMCPLLNLAPCHGDIGELRYMSSPM